MILDGVCSVASEEILMDAWGIDVVLTASQKGLSTPPGLSILVASQKAIEVCIMLWLLESFFPTILYRYLNPGKPPLHLIMQVGRSMFFHHCWPCRTLNLMEIKMASHNVCL